MRRRIRFFVLATALLVTAGTGALAGTVLEEVRSRGYLSCGVSELAGRHSFTNMDDSGVWQGFDVDFCRAIAAAVLGDKNLVAFVQLGSANRFEALQRGNVDVLIRVTTWTYSRDAGLGISFPAVTFYDAQGFMTHRSTGIASLDDESVRGAKVCANDNSTSLDNLLDFIRASGNGLEPLVTDSPVTRWEAFVNGRCELVTTDMSGLISGLAALSSQPGDFVILKESISKEPLGPSVRDGDPQWFDIVRWVVFATIAAEEKGISSSNVEGMLGARDPETRRMLGIDPGLGAPLGLDDRWLYRIIAQIGNYGEIYERMMGAVTQEQFDRGLNSLWTDGGLHYSMPFR